MSFNFDGTPTNQSIAADTPPATPPVTAAAEAPALPPVTAPDMSAAAPAPITAPSAIPPAGYVNTDAAAVSNAEDYYAHETKALKAIGSVMDGQLSISNANPISAATAKIKIAGKNVRLAPGYGSGQEISLGGQSRKEPLELEFDVEHLDLAHPDAAESAIKSELARISGLAKEYDLSSGHHHTLPVFNTMMSNFFKLHPKTSENQFGFDENEVKLLEGMNFLQAKQDKLDSVRNEYYWCGDKPSALTLDFEFKSLDAAHVDFTEKNIKAREAGIKAHFVHTLIEKGIIASTNKDPVEAQKEITAKADRMKADLRMLVDRVPDSTPPVLKVSFGFPKDPLQVAVTSANDFNPDALAAITSDKADAVRDAFNNAVAFGESPDNAPGTRWDEIYSMFGAEQLRYFLEHRAAGMKANAYKDSPEKAAALEEQMKTLRSEDVISSWQQQREARATQKLPAIGVAIVPHGVMPDPANPSGTIPYPAKVRLSIPVPGDKNAVDVWNLIANSPVADRPAPVRNPLLESSLETAAAQKPVVGPWTGAHVSAAGSPGVGPSMG